MWFSQNFLFLNESKTEVIVFGPHDNYDSNNIDLDYLDPKSSCIKNLGVLWDQNLKFEKQINTVIACFFQLHLLSKIKSSLSEKTLEIAIHALITSRLDYCNSLYFGIPKHSIARLQLAQTECCCKVPQRKRKFDHVSPILKFLHWLRAF